LSQNQARSQFASSLSVVEQLERDHVCSIISAPRSWLSRVDVLLGGEKGTLEQIQRPDVSAFGADAQDQQRKQGRGWYGSAIIILIYIYLDLHYASVYLAKDNLPCVSIFALHMMNIPW
jgi:hypothetical protein